MRIRSWMIAGTAFAVGLAASWGLLVIGSGAPGRAVPPAAAGLRVVSLAPNITETIFALGADDLLVGVTVFCNDPPAARRIPRVGGPLNPSRERILSLNPHIIVAQMPNSSMERFCRDHGIRFEALEMTSLARIEHGILRLGRLLDRGEAAARLASSIRTELNEIRRRTQSLRRPRTLLTIGRRPGSLSSIYTTGRGSFLGEILEIAGGANIFADLGASYAEVSKEAICRRAPEVIIETVPGAVPDASLASAVLRDWETLGDIPAVATGRIYVVTNAVIQIPGPRVAKAARLLAACCHPGVFEMPTGVLRVDHTSDLH